MPEWMELLADPRVKLWLASMELDASDAFNLFTLIDNSHDGQLSLDELTTGVAKLKGSARSIDLLTLMREHSELNDSVHMLGESVKELKMRLWDPVVTASDEMFHL